MIIKLYDDEKIITTVRRHWFIVALQIFFLTLLLVLPILFLSATGQYQNPLAQIFIQDKLEIVLLYFLWALTVWTFFFVAWTSYYLDAFVITNKRIIDIEQLGLFARDVSEMRLEKIQDIKVETIGILASLLNFGTISIQSAGEAKEFLITFIPNPTGIKDLVFKLHDEIVAQTKQSGA